MFICCVCMLTCFSRVWLFATLWTAAHQAPLSMGFSRQEYWSGLPCPPPGDLPDPGIKPLSLSLLHWLASSLSLAPLCSRACAPQQVNPATTTITCYWESSVQFSHSVVSDSLPSHGLQHTRLPCPSPTPGACSDSCPLSRWCHPTTSSSLVPFSSSLQFFPASGSFPMSQFSTSGSQSIGASASASVLPLNIQDWFPLGLTVLKVQGTLKSLLQHHSSKASILQRSAFLMVQLSHPYMTTGKTIALIRQTFVGKVVSLLFNMLSRLVIAFLPRSKH